MIQSIFHVNINVSDFERSLAFYQTLGFRIVNDLGTGSSPQLDAGLQIPNGQARAALLMLGDNPHATRIDLIESVLGDERADPVPEALERPQGIVVVR